MAAWTGGNIYGHNPSMTGKCFHSFFPYYFPPKNSCCKPKPWYEYDSCCECGKEIECYQDVVVNREHATVMCLRCWLFKRG